MPTLDTTAIGYTLKRVYGDTISDLFPNAAITYNLFFKSNRNISMDRPAGEGYYFSTRQADTQGVGGRAEGAYLPEPLKGDGVQGYVLPKMIYSVVRVSGLALEAGKGNVAAFVDAKGDAVMNAYRSLIYDLNRQCHGDGFGALATLSTTSDAASTSATWTITCANDVGVRYLRKGMVVDFYESTTLNNHTPASRISSIDPTNQTAEMEAVASFASGGGTYQAYHPIVAARTYTTSADTIDSAAVVVRYGARLATFDSSSDTPYEVTGLDGMYDDGTLLTTFEGINTSNDPEFKANILGNSGVNREVSLDLMISAVDMTMARSDESVGIIRMGLGQERKYYGLLAPDIRFTPGELQGGFTRLKFARNSQIEIVVDPVAQPNKMYFEPKNVIKRYELTPIGWGGAGDNRQMHWRQDYDESTMFLRTYTNLGVEKRNSLTLLKDLNEPSNAPW